MIVSTAEGREVPWSFMLITKKLYMLPVLRLVTVATVSVRFIVCKEETQGDKNKSGAEKKTI